MLFQAVAPKMFKSLVRRLRRIRFWGCCSMLLWVGPFLCAEKVLAIHSYHKGLSWTDDISRGIIDVFEPYAGDIQLYFEYLDLKRNSGEIYEHLIYQLIEQKFKNLQFDLIIICDNDALHFVRKYHKHLFGDIPIVFCGVNHFQPAWIEDFDRVTGVMERSDHGKNLQVIGRLHPHIHKLVVLGDYTLTGGLEWEVFKKAYQAYGDRFTVEKLAVLDLDKLPEQLDALEEDTVIYLLPFSRDGQGRFISYSEFAQLLPTITKRPIYTSWDFYLGSGIIGGYLTTGFDQGVQVGRMGLTMLGYGDGSAEEIPSIIGSKGRYIFDYEALVAHGGSLAQLPKGSKVINQPDDFFIRHKTLILSGLALVVLAFIATNFVIYRLRAQKAKLNAAVKERTAELEDALDELQIHYKRLDNRNVDLLEMARERREFLSIAMHDLKNPLSSLKLLAHLLSNDLSKDEKAMKSIRILEESAESMLYIINNLLNIDRADAKPETVATERVDVDGLLRHLVEINQPNAQEKRIGLRVSMPDVRVQVMGDYAKLQEALDNLLSNAMKYGPWGSLVTVSLTFDDAHAIIKIQDQGAGFTKEDRKKLFGYFQKLSARPTGDETSHGLGLFIAKKWIDMHRGTIELLSDPGEGACFLITLPLAKAEPQADL